MPSFTIERAQGFWRHNLWVDMDGVISIRVEYCPVSFYGFVKETLRLSHVGQCGSQIRNTLNIKNILKYLTLNVKCWQYCPYWQ
jgi:hypothetical protein